MAQKTSFLKAVGQERLNRKRVMIIALIVLVVFLIFIYSLRFFKKEKPETQVAEVPTAMVPSSIKYYNPDTSETYTTGTDYVIMNQSDGTRVKVNSDGSVYYVDAEGKNISIVENPNDYIIAAMGIANTDVQAGMALDGLANQDTEPELTPVEQFETELKAELESRGIDVNGFYSKMYAIGTTPEVLYTLYRMSGSMTTVINQVLSEYDARFPTVETPEADTSTGIGAAILQNTNQQSSSSESTSTDLPDWLQPIDINDSLTATMNRLASATSGSTTDYDQQNAQQQKKDWQAEQRSVGFSAGNRLTKWDLAQGSVIPVTLVTGLNTDMPGEIVGLVRQNIYDTLTGTNIVIPKGSRVMANYDSSVAFAQKRVAIAWNYLITPDGYTYTLPGFNGVDGEGYSGNEDKHSNHIFSLIGGAMLASLIDSAVGNVEDQANSLSNVSPEYAILGTVAGAGVEATGTIAEQYVDKLINRQPTIRIRPGAQITMLVTETINLER